MTTTGLINRHEARSLVLDGTADTGYPARKDRWYQFVTALGDTEQYHAHSVRTWVAEHPPAGSVAPDAPDLRQAAIAAVFAAMFEVPYLDVYGRSARPAAEAAVNAAFDTLAEGLYIAPDRHGISCVWTDKGEPVMAHIGVGPSERLWALLAAVIPNLEETP